MSKIEDKLCKLINAKWQFECVVLPCRKELYNMKNKCMSRAGQQVLEI